MKRDVESFMDGNKSIEIKPVYIVLQYMKVLEIGT